MLYLLFRAVRLCQIRQDIRPQSLLLPQGIEAAVQIHLIDRCKNGAAQQQTLIVERSLRLGCLAAEHHRKTGLQFLAEDIVGCPGGAVLPLHFEQGVDVFQREDIFRQYDIDERSQLFAGILLFDGVGDDSFLDVVAHHGGGELHPGEIPEIAVDELDGLVQIQPHLGQVTVPGQGKACGTGRNAAVQFLFHAVSIAHFKIRVNGKTKTF